MRTDHENLRPADGPETLLLFVVRDDADDGAVLHVTDQRPEAEAAAVDFLGTHFRGPAGEAIPTCPRLEVYRVALGPLVEPVEPLATIGRRVRRRRRQLEREAEQARVELGLPPRRRVPQ